MMIHSNTENWELQVAKNKLLGISTGLPNDKDL